VSESVSALSVVGHGLAVAVDAPAVGAALCPVHWRTLLGLAHVGTRLEAAPEVRARIVQLQKNISLGTVRFL
jgi:hypothetical protein